MSEDIHEHDYNEGDRVVIVLRGGNERELRGTVRDVSLSSSWVDRVVDLDNPRTLQGKCIGVPFCKSIRMLGAVDALAEIT